MRIGLIADVHANHRALRTVLNDAPDVGQWICAGDVVGYYPEVNEVCETLIRQGVHAVRGNHDAYVSGALSPAPERRDAYRTDWTRETLTPENRHWLAGLPVELSLCLGAWHVRVRHASPWDEETYLYPDSSHLTRIELERNQYLVVGHTHRPMVRLSGAGYLVNPGAVGQPRDYNPAASYAVLDTVTGTVENRRVAYDVSAYQRFLTGLGWPVRSIAVLSRTA